MSFTAQELASLIAKPKPPSRGAHNAPKNPAKGARHWRARLTDAQVQEIRDWREAGETYQAIADRFGVSYWTVRDIAQGRTR